MRSSVMILTLGFLFGLGETVHYGWDLTATSDGAMICDGITFLIWSLGYLCISVEKQRTPVTVNRDGDPI